jgi:hypothetical protein
VSPTALADDNPRLILLDWSAHSKGLSDG